MGKLSKRKSIKHNSKTQYGGKALSKTRRKKIYKESKFQERKV